MAHRNLANAICAMWNLTPEYLEQVKEELKGRRAAVQARIADELKSLDDDIEEIETIERLAYAFAAKHVRVDEPASAEKDESPMVASLQGGSAEDVVAAEPAPEPNQGKGLSGWRSRLGRQPAESA
jgi:uncharacterized protein YdcH (DUF465 family)